MTTTSLVIVDDLPGRRPDPETAERVRAWWQSVSGMLNRLGGREARPGVRDADRAVVVGDELGRTLVAAAGGRHGLRVEPGSDAALRCEVLRGLGLLRQRLAPRPDSRAQRLGGYAWFEPTPAGHAAVDAMGWRPVLRLSAWRLAAGVLRCRCGHRWRLIVSRAGFSLLEEPR